MALTQEHISGLVEQYGDMVLRLSYTYLKNKADAEDVVQDVFMRIVEKHPDFNDKAHEKLVDHSQKSGQRNEKNR